MPSIDEVGTSQKLLKILLKIPHQNMKLRLFLNHSHLHILNPLSSQEAGMPPQVAPVLVHW